MSKTAHRLYISILSGIVIFATIYLGYKGYSYYSTPLEERFYHPDHTNFKPGGLYGHGLGIIGTLLMLVGVVMYIIRKRFQSLYRWGRLKHWLEFHIFLCSLGPVMILYHTAFKFGGIVSIAFWSMVAVVVSGVIGRYIYIQIPRTIEGREMGLNEIQQMKTDLQEVLCRNYQLNDQSMELVLASVGRRERKSSQRSLLSGIFLRYVEDQRIISGVRKTLRQNQLGRRDIGRVVKIIKNELALNKRIERLQSMQKLFKYWHVAHLPFAIIMLVIVVVHVIVALLFGYKWIF